MNKKHIIEIVIVLILAVLGTAGAYAYREIARLEASDNVLEKETALLTESLQKTGTVTKDTQTALQQLAAERAVVTKAEDQPLTVAVAKVSPAVVSVVVSKDVPQLKLQYENPFGNDQAGKMNIKIPVYRESGTTQQKVGAGSGFLVRADGYIVTNRHVVEDPNASYTVLLSTGIQKKATVLYTDSVHDLAIIKIAGTGYPTVTLGNSAGLKLGQTVAAIGNALGEYSNSVSVGIVSGLHRSIDVTDENGTPVSLDNVIQTDAAINLGNSGGPLFDLSGTVIGVNVATVVGSNNISFSIPSNDVQEIIGKIVSHS